MKSYRSLIVRLLRVKQEFTSGISVSKVTVKTLKMTNALEYPRTSTTDENVEKVKEMVMNDRRITIREVADDVGISIGSSHEIFSNMLGMKLVAAKFVPKLLNFEQKERRMEVAQE